MSDDLPQLKFDRKRFKTAPVCPCGKHNRDGKYAPFQGFQDKGYCFSCGETFLPEIEKDLAPRIQPLRPEPPPSFIHPDILKASLTRYDQNSFVQFLSNTFGSEITSRVVSRYFVGTTRKGAACFWQIDRDGKIRSGKIISYDPVTGHRLKNVCPVWVHSEMKLPEFRLKQCLFGAHLLKGNSRPAAVVESEKTAIIASLYFPDFIWLACGGKDGLTNEKMQILKGRKVVLFPDLDGFELWTRRAAELEPMLDIKVSDLLERKASLEERTHKLDVADYLLKYPIKERKQHFTEPDSNRDKMPLNPKGQAPRDRTPMARMIELYPNVAEFINKLDFIQL